MATYSDGITQYGKGRATNATGGTGTYTIQTDDFIEYTLLIVDADSASNNLASFLTSGSQLLTDMKILTGKCKAGVVGIEQATTGSNPWIIRLGDSQVSFPSTNTNFFISLDWHIYRNISAT